MNLIVRTTVLVPFLTPPPPLIPWYVQLNSALTHLEIFRFKHVLWLELEL